MASERMRRGVVGRDEIQRARRDKRNQYAAISGFCGWASRFGHIPVLIDGPLEQISEQRDAQEHVCKQENHCTTLENKEPKPMTT